MLTYRNAALVGVCLVLLITLPGFSAASSEGDRVTAAAAAYRLELVEDNLNQLVAMAFDSANRLFFTEKSGSVRLIVNDVLQDTPVITFDVDTCGERGLLGIALDPAFDTNHYIYVYYTVNTGTPCGVTVNQVVRFTEVGGIGQDPVVIFTSPAGSTLGGNHNGGNVHFGPDGKLYVTVGDDGMARNSQDLSVRNGKMNRINADGTIPEDNPFYGQTGIEWSIYSYGLRNSFDFDFDPVSGVLFAAENGPNCDDEVNALFGGYNYGWRPAYPCGDMDRTYNTIRPLIRWTPVIVPVGITFYRGSLLPALINQLFLCTYQTGSLHHLVLNADRTRITRDVIVGLPGGATCNQDIETGTDGALYFVQGGGYSIATIYRIVPQ